MRAILRKSQAQEPFSFVFASDEGKMLVKSENYTAKKSALNGIESVKKNCLSENRFELKESKNGMFFFNLKASNGQVVATSTMFTSVDERDRAVVQLQQEAPRAELEEQVAA